METNLDPIIALVMKTNLDILTSKNFSLSISLALSPDLAASWQPGQALQRPQAG